MKCIQLIKSNVGRKAEVIVIVVATFLSCIFALFCASHNSPCWSELLRYLGPAGPTRILMLCLRRLPLFAAQCRHSTALSFQVCDYFFLLDFIIAKI